MDYPEEMKHERRWCTWFYETNPQHPNDVHALKKVPHSLNSKMLKDNAKTNEIETWGNYRQACNAYSFTQNNPDWVKENQYGGLGFMISDGWVFLDLDNIPTVIADYSLGQHTIISEIVEILDHTYCEVSQSQGGLHFLFKLDDSVDSFTNKKHNKELYDKGRMVALTGNVLDTDQPLKITTINQEQWEKLNRLIFGKYEKPNSFNSDFGKTELSHGVLSEEGLAVIDAIMKSNIAQRFNWWLNADLPTVSTGVSDKKFTDWEGKQIYYDPSRQDSQCCKEIAFFVRKVTKRYDSKLIDEIFKQTNLYRPKWNRLDGGGTYGQRTIQSAINYQKQRRKKWEARHGYNSNQTMGWNEGFKITVKDGSVD